MSRDTQESDFVLHGNGSQTRYTIMGITGNICGINNGTAICAYDTSAIV